MRALAPGWCCLPPTHCAVALTSCCSCPCCCCWCGWAQLYPKETPAMFPQFLERQIRVRPSVHPPLLHCFVRVHSMCSSYLLLGRSGHQARGQRKATAQTLLIHSSRSVRHCQLRAAACRLFRVHSLSACISDELSRSFAIYRQRRCLFRMRSSAHR